jgi:nucleoid-associated protein YgaU
MKYKFIRRAGFALVALSLLAVVGCGGGVDRQVDVSAGEYYTPEEVQKLNKDQYTAYCASLDTELTKVSGEATSTQAAVGTTQAQVAAAQKDVKALESQYNGKKAETDAVQKDIDYFKGLPKMWTVREGEFLHKISGYEEIYADALKWPRIYRANKDKIEDPNLIYPGWQLAIPRDWPSTWTVQQDEYLSKIAWYWEVYDDPGQWTKLYEANKDRINDPDIIWPGWELRIPRD